MSEQSKRITAGEARQQLIKLDAAPVSEQAVQHLIAAAYKAIRRIMHRQRTVEVPFQRFETVLDVRDAEHMLHRQAMSLGHAAAIILAEQDGFNVEVLQRDWYIEDEDALEGSDMVEYYLLISWEA